MTTAMCAECSRLHGVIEALRLDVENLQTDLVAKRRLITKLRRENEEHARNNPDMALAAELFDFWRAQCHHPRAALDASRIRTAVARIVEYRELGEDYMQRLKNAIRGYAVGAYEKDGQRFDDFELILRDAKHVELGERRWRLHQRRRTEPRAVVDALRERFGDPLHDRVLDVFLTGCPVCGAGDGLYRPFQLRVNDTVTGTCTGCNASIDDVKRVLLDA